MARKSLVTLVVCRHKIYPNQLTKENVSSFLGHTDGSCLGNGLQKQNQGELRKHDFDSIDTMILHVAGRKLIFLVIIRQPLYFPCPIPTLMRYVQAKHKQNSGRFLQAKHIVVSCYLALSNTGIACVNGRYCE